MTRRKYNLAAVVTALLLVIAITLGFVLSGEVADMVSGADKVFAAETEISVDEGYVVNGSVAKDYDHLANVPEGYTAQDVYNDDWSALITGKDTTNKYYYLGEDVTLSEIDGVTEFKGILDGCGNTITLNIETTLDASGGNDQIVGGLFKLINGGTVKNVTIKVTKYSVGVNNIGIIAGIIAGQTLNNAVLQNVRVDLDYMPAEQYKKADDGSDGTKNYNVNYLYETAQRTSGAKDYMILGGVVGDIAGNTTIDETTVSVNANSGCEPVPDGQDDTDPGFGISGWRAADNTRRYYILGGFVGRVNDGTLSMTNVNLEGDGKILNYSESDDTVGDIFGLGGDKRYNRGYAGGFVGEVISKLEIDGLNYLFTGALGKTNMGEENPTGAIVGKGGSNSSLTTIANVYFASTSTQRGSWVMGDSENFNGGIVYDISAPVYVSGGKLVIPAQKSVTWQTGNDALYSVTDKNGVVYVVEDYMIVDDATATGDVYLSMPMFGNVEFKAEGNQQDYGKLYTLNYYTMGSADIADGFDYDEGANTYSYSKTYDGVANAKDISVKLSTGVDQRAIDVFGGEKENSGNAGEYSFALDKSKYAAAGVEEVQVSCVGSCLLDKENGAIYRMNFNDGSKINVSINKLAVEIAFDGAGNITYGDSIDTVKANNPVSIISVGGASVGDTVTTPDEFTGYSLTGYVEKTAAGSEVILGIADVAMNGAESNYVFTLGSAKATVAKYQITGKLQKDKFTTDEVAGGATAVFVPDTTLPDEVVFSYGYSNKADSSEWKAEMPTASDRYYVRVTFDDPNYSLGTSVYTFTVTAVVTVGTTDKVVDGVFTTEYLNTAQKLAEALAAAVDYEAEVKEESDYFEFSVNGEVIADALDASESNYTVTATLKSQRYEEASVTFEVRVVTQKIYITGETPNASWDQLENGVYDGEDKTSFGLTTADEFEKNYAITFCTIENGEYTPVSSVKNAGYYKIVATSADPNYEIVDSEAGIGSYYVEKATPIVDFSGIEVSIVYGAATVSGDVVPVISGAYDTYGYNVCLLTESGADYTATSVNAGGKITVSTKDFAFTANAENYNDVVVIGKEITVGKANITVVTTNRNVTYGDELSYVAADFYGSVSGLVGNDAVTAEFTTDYVAGIEAGSTVDVVLTFAFLEGNADNYVFNGGEPVVAELTVDKRVINGELVAPQSTYDGMPYDLTEIVSEGIVEGDTVNITVKYSVNGIDYVPNAPVDAGTYYAKVVSIDNPNYEMGEIADGVQFTIEKAAAPTITVTAKEGLVYDGSEKALKDSIVVTVEGLFAGDESLANYVQTICLTKMIDAGDYTVTVSLGGLANYEDAETTEATVTVAKAPVTVQLRNGSVVYGDELTGNETYFVSASGTVGSDAFVVIGYDYLTEYVAGQTPAGTTIEVSVGYTLDNADNYIVNGGEPLVALLNVEKRALGGTIYTAAKTYDGTAYGGASATWNNLSGEDVVTVTFEYSTDGKTYSATAPVDAGTYYVRVAGVENNGNYVIGAIVPVKFTIAKAAAPVITASAKDVVYSGSIVDPKDTVEYTVSGFIAGEESLVSEVNVYSNETILAAGEYGVGIVLKGLRNYEDAETIIVTVTVSRAETTLEATARMGYGYVEVTVNDRETVEYSFDQQTWTKLAADGRIAIDVTNVITLYLRYVQTENFNQSAVTEVKANITFDVLEEYVGRNYLNTEVTFANVNEIGAVLNWQEDAIGEKSDTYETVVGGLEDKYAELLLNANETIAEALGAGASLSGHQKLTATVLSVSAGGLALAVGALAIKRRKGGKKDEK